MASSSIGIIPVNANKGVFVDIYDDGERPMMLGGKPFYLIGDTKFGKDSVFNHETKHPGQRARWAIVLATSDYAEERGIRVGQKVLCAFGEWSVKPVVYERETGKKFWWIKAEGIELIDEDGPTEEERAYIESRYSNKATTENDGN